MKLLAGDVGGTKADLAVLSTESGPREPLAAATYPCAEYPNLESVAAEFLASSDVSVDGATFGVAGPVADGRVQGTNLPWLVDARQVATTLDVPQVTLLNDLEAIAYSVPILDESDLAVVNEGNPVAQEPLGIVAPGTGLGEAFLTWQGDRYVAHASEGGHADFAPNSALEAELYTYLRKKYGGHVSYERACSGSGLPDVYAFMKERLPEPERLARALAEVDDPNPIIVEEALSDQGCELCRATLDLFVGVLAAEAGNMALRVLARGGVYLGGGIPPRIIPALQRPSFVERYAAKGRLRDVVAEMPVYVITNPKAGLLGAAAYGLRALED